MKLSRPSRSPPSISLADALAAASRRNGRDVAEVWSAIWLSALQLEARLAEDPTASEGLLRFAPHWRIQFARTEGFLDLERGHGPMYSFVLDDADDLQVFEDGCAMTFDEVRGRA